MEIKSNAPARICLFGDHQDYLNLPVIACAINRFIKIKAKPNNSKIFKIFKTDLNEIDQISINDSLKIVKKEDYFRLALKVVKKYGCNPTKGYDLHISSDIPIKAGLSSSSSLVIAWIQFLVSTFKIDLKISPLIIAKLAYEAEVIEQGSSGGKMDQYTICNGNMIYLDPSDDNIQILKNPINTLIVGDSGESKDTLGMLAFLKKKSWESINKVKSRFPEFNIKKVDLKDLNLYYDLLGGNLSPFFEAAVMNYKITQKALNELSKNKIPNKKYIGRLITEHHLLLKNNLKITTEKIDSMIESSIESGAYGAKIIGSGGGGCIVALADKNNANKIITKMKNAGAKDAFEVEISKGPSIS